MTRKRTQIITKFRDTFSQMAEEIDKSARSLLQEEEAKNEQQFMLPASEDSNYWKPLDPHLFHDEFDETETDAEPQVHGLDDRLRHRWECENQEN